jgi:cytochrome c551/c552
MKFILSNITLSNITSATAARIGKLALTAVAGALGFAACSSGAASDIAAGNAFFTQKGCVQCHSVSVYGVKSAAQIGPDLSDAVNDVPRRFGKPLEEFLANPTGTMQMVLSSQIKLTDAEKQEAIRLIKKADELKKAGH